ncbi:glucans biosynthesis glucosyltransferase MdoH [Zymomonas mobilis]|uniref:Glucans biosynthesis glucosyltransferase H n=1 Tax=Zymomonas mobilis subsp. pomaceae (strain ATCC 29192 / DSM 22645 / JCM 10191 / CCUG 17912 / NBRC 13757 / NCIMB 11200 / NRRL B-4491 / Barker I) TaxID=579138 RepID=F8EUX6_ZYMMT|nr:glucans biosynthesis glucosyltransferase MdoH [Zymomonas mobilis]AEI37264.1 glycosyl transferase family 2 [Zymomonas mobilis subsp. pomaceae ATCC 29192]MDX5948633.1 glucans biosynthesis glucosyltransferase MdoH [Zymomonas mobilis subsp. pomaceae]GEB88439.1 glucans biosynthesis glucosyltransferase H [Zymomonas mobilis subsp. pomaceae]
MTPTKTSIEQPTKMDEVFFSLPPRIPIAMPIQSWDKVGPITQKPKTSPPGIGNRRGLLFGITIIVAIAAAADVWLAEAVQGISFSEILIFLLFSPLFAWLFFGFMGALIGFIQLVRGRASADYQMPPASVAPRGKTAILMPIYNEDVDMVYLRIKVIAQSIAKTGFGKHFEFFILSDSNPANGLIEFAALKRLKEEVDLPVWYRRREKNIARKPGNIADWIHNFGGGYDYMLILDADSLMAGQTITRMAASLDRDKGLALLQTVPMPVNGQTFFARWQQFSARLYGPLASAGLIWWSGSEASFWGHNAIVRVKAFAESCGLPKLSGKEPFGGNIMSHDVVEATLLRRKGWTVHTIMAEGSYEEYPPTLIDGAIRDRRWCQGNLQHTRLLGIKGLHWVNRLQLLIGVTSYATSTVWLFLLIATLMHHFGGAGANLSLSPSPWLLILTVICLFGAKILAVIWAVMDRRRSKALGGVSGILASVVIEIPLSAFIAPMLMVTQTITFIDIIRGRPSGWNTQRREVDGIDFSEAFNHYRPHMIVGVIFALLALIGGGSLTWLLMVAIGLILAPAIAYITSCPAMGRALAGTGIFITPEEHRQDGTLEASTASGIVHIALKEAATMPLHAYSNVPKKSQLSTAAAMVTSSRTKVVPITGQN